MSEKIDRLCDKYGTENVAAAFDRSHDAYGSIIAAAGLQMKDVIEAAADILAPDEDQGESNGN